MKPAYLIFGLLILGMIGTVEGYGYFYFQNENQYLTTEEPEVSVCGYNVGQIDLALYKLDVDSIYEFVATSDSQEAQRIIEAALSGGPLKSWSVTISEEDDWYNCEELEFDVYKESIPGSQRGLYFIKGVSNVSNQTTSFIISDLGIMTKRWGDNLIVYAINIGDGSPVQGANVNIYEGSEFLASKKTNADGIIEQKLNSNSSTVNVIAEHEGDISFVTPYYYSYYAQGSKIYVYTDRPVYRPNQKVYFKAIVWKQNEEGYEIPKGDVIVEIKDPKWNTVYKKNLTLGEFGSVSGSMPLGDEPPLGDYNIEVRGEGIYSTYDWRYGYSGYGSFEVQEYKKPEYKVTLSSDEGHYINGDNISVEINAEYFFGSPVPDAEVEYRVYSSGYYYPCRGYGCWYYEESYYPYYYGGEVDRGTTVTGSDGKATINFKAETEYNSVYLIEASVIDKSRREASGTTTVIVARAEYDFQVSTDKYSYDTGDTVSITIESHDIGESPLSAYGEIEIVRRTWENNERKEVTVYKKEFETAENGKKLIEFVPDEAGYFEIIVTGEDSRGNKIESTRWFYVYDEERRWYDYWESLEIVLDKQVYEVGDEATVLINSPVANFTALVSLEGTKVYEYYVVTVEGTTARLKVPVKSEYQPNVNVYVLIVKDKTQYTNNVPLVVPPEEKFLNIEILSDKEEYEPRDDAIFTVKTTDSNGNPVSAELSLGIVDESIYSIVDESMPEIEKYFYGRRWTSVSTQASWVYGGQLHYAMEGAVQAAVPGARAADMMIAEESEALMDGGFSAKSAGGLVAPTIRKYFPDTAFWHAHVMTNSDGEATIRLEMPDSLTTWRATARGITKDFKVGQEKDTVIARKDMIVRLEMPRFITQNDELTISAVVHNYLGKMKDVQVVLKADGVEVLDPLTKTISVAHGADERVDWRIRVEDCCLANFTVKALTDVESDAMEMAIPIIPHGIEEQDVWAGTVDDSITKTIIVPEDSIYGATELKLVLSPSIAATAFDALDYLAKYPYGCVEQTMSAFLPDVIVAQVLKDLGIENKELEEKLPDMVNKGLQNLYNMQHSDGGWGWWENDETNPYMTAYVVYGLTQAKNAGYSVDANVLSRGLRALRSLYSEGDIDSNIRAYMAYSMSFHGSVDLSKLKESEMNDYARALEVLARVNMGQDIDFPSSLEGSAICDEIRCNWDSETYKYSWRNNNVETTSYVLMALLKTDPTDSKVVRTVRWLVENRRGNHWYSTKDTAIAVFALAEYLKISKELSPDYVANVYLNGDLVESVKKDDAFSMDNEIMLDAATGRNEIKIEKNGQGNLYYSILLKYFKMDEDIKAKSNGITVTRKYSRTEAQSGDEINVTLNIDVPSDAEYIILEEPIPAGCEVVEHRDTSGYYWDYGWSWWYSRREVRDEKVVYFMTYVHPGENKITYILRAEVPGSYHIMPALAYNMYDDTIRGHSAENRLDIVDKIRVKITNVKIEPNELRFTVNALKFIEGDLSGEVLVEVEDERGNLLKQQREYMSIKNAEQNQEVVIPLSLSDGFYVIRYVLTTSEGTKVGGSKRIQVGELEVTRVGTQEPGEPSAAAKPSDGGITDLTVLVVLVVLLLLILVAITRVREKKKGNKKEK